MYGKGFTCLVGTGSAELNVDAPSHCELVLQQHNLGYHLNKSDVGLFSYDRKTSVTRGSDRIAGGTLKVKA